MFARNTSHASSWQTVHIETARVDQWLWSVRLTKTRSDAAGACRAGHVKVNGKAAKPSTAVKVGDRVEARLGQRERIAIISKVIAKRVGAAVAVDCFEDHSPPEPERAPIDLGVGVRDRGTGRPTKRDRRQMEKFRGR